MLLAATVAALVLAAPALAGSDSSTETRFLPELAAAAAQVSASATGVSGLGDRPDAVTLGVAGERLAAATSVAKRALKAYQSATTRFGSAKEHELVTMMLRDLRLAGAGFGKLTGSPIRTTPRKLSLAEQLVGQVSHEAVLAAVEKWSGLEAMVALAKNPDQARKIVRRQLVEKIAREIQKKRRQIARRALKKSIPIQFGVPLKQQIRAEVESWAFEKLAGALLKFDPTGLVLSLIGGDVLIRMLIADIAQAFRGTGEVEVRTGRTGRILQRHENRLKELQENLDSDIDEVADAVAGAEGALTATRFLERDLRKLVKRRCKGTRLNSKRCKGAQTTLAALLAAQKSLKRAVTKTVRDFLLDGQFDPGELRGWVKALCEMERDVKRINKKLPPPPAPVAEPADCPTGSLEVTVSPGGPLTMAFTGAASPSASQLTCSYESPTGFAKVNIEINWTPEGSTTLDPAGACHLGPGAVLKEGFFWKSRMRKVEAAWAASNVSLTNPTEEQLLKPLVEALESKGVGALC